MRTIIKCLAALALCHSMTAQAVPITLTFEAIVFDGTFAGQSGTGSITYEDSWVPSTGEVFLGFSGGAFADEEALTAFSFTFLGQNYSHSDDAFFPDLPLFSLFDGFADSLDFFVEDLAGVDILDNRIVDFQVFGEFLDGGLRDSNNGYDFAIDMYVNERQFSTVPAPNVFHLCLLICSFFIYRRGAF